MSRARKTAVKPKAEGGSRLLKVLSATGVLAAAAIAVLLNVLVAREYKRWDWTSSGLYTLSTATLQTLHALTEPVTVTVLLAANDPLSVSVRQMLTAYAAETEQLRVRFLDPDRNPAEFLAVQQKYGIMTGKTEDGRVVSDASIIIARGGKHWFITSDDVVAVDDEHGTARPRIEQALTEGLRNVLEREKSKICASAGHEEMSVDDGGATGIAELRFRLEKNNYDVQAVELRGPKLPSLATCQVLLIAGPQVPFGEAEARHIAEYLKSGGNVMALASAGLDDDNRIEPLGLDVVAAAGGIALSNDVIIETDEARRLPEGMGETFFVTEKAHDITAGLARPGSKVSFRVLVSLAQSLTKARPDSAAAELLVTSDSSFAMREIRSFVESGEVPKKRAEDKAGPFAVAMASELPKPPGSTKKHGPRLIFGPPSLAYARNWREPTLIGNRVFMESALSWLAAQPAIVSVPEKASHAVGLSLTEEALGEVFRYVILFMPASAALLGAFVLLRRRAVEKKSRA